MKRLGCILLLCLLLLGCAGEKREASVSRTQEPLEELSIPQELPGVWVSASEGQQNMVETITFYENGEMSVSSLYHDQDMGTVFGTYGVRGGTIYCSITDGTDPYEVTYEYRIDGRELTLEDDDGPAHYLRTS